jgi:hypothetical protein
MVLAFTQQCLCKQSMNCTTSQVGRQQVRAMNGAAHTVAYDKLAPSYVNPIVPTTCNCTEDNNSQPQLVSIY